MKSSSIEQVSQIVPQKLKKNEIPSQVVNQQVNHMVTQSLTEKSKSDFLKTDQQAHENSELSISHQKQLRSRITQRSNSPPQLDSHDQMYLTKNINDIDLVFGEPPINQPMDNTIPSTQRMKILRWLSTLGLCPRPPAYDPCSGQAYQNANPELDLEDDWNNGVLLSQLAAICSHGNRNEVKEVVLTLL